MLTSCSLAVNASNKTTQFSRHNLTLMLTSDRHADNSLAAEKGGQAASICP